MMREFSNELLHIVKLYIECHTPYTKRIYYRGKSNHSSLFSVLFGSRAISHRSQKFLIFGMFCQTIILFCFYVYIRLLFLKVSGKGMNEWVLLNCLR